MDPSFGDLARTPGLDEAARVWRGIAAPARRTAPVDALPTAPRDCQA